MTQAAADLQPDTDQTDPAGSRWEPRYSRCREPGQIQSQSVGGTLNAANIERRGRQGLVHNAGRFVGILRPWIFHVTFPTIAEYR